MGNQGLNGGQALSDSGAYNFIHSLYQQIPLMAQAGAGWVRVNFRLGGHFADWTTPDGNGVTALQQYDHVIAQAQAYHLQVLGLLSNETWKGAQSDWTANNAENTAGNGDNTYLQNFSLNAAVVLATHFAGKITTWEIWNEPDAYTVNHNPIFTGGTFIYPSNFAWLLHHIYNDTRTAGLTGLTFVSGGLFSNDLGTVLNTESGATYLSNTYQQGQLNAGWNTDLATWGSYPLDVVGQHIYIDQSKLTNTNRIKTYVLAVRFAYLAYEGDASFKQTMITEIGWQSNTSVPYLQESDLQGAFVELHILPSVLRTFWFAVQDIPEANQHYGLFDSNGSVKPSFAAYTKYANY